MSESKVSISGEFLSADVACSLIESSVEVRHLQCKGATMRWLERNGIVRVLVETSNGEYAALGIEAS